MKTRLLIVCLIMLMGAPLGIVENSPDVTVESLLAGMVFLVLFGEARERHADKPQKRVHGVYG